LSIKKLESQKAVFFDIGSTLVEGPEISPAKYITRLLELPVGESSRLGQLIMCREYKGWEELCCDLDESFRPLTDQQEAEIARLWEGQETAASEINEATAVVARFAGEGYQVGLVSNIWAPYYRSFLKACPEIARISGCAALSFQTGKKKPSFALLKKGLSVLGADPQRSIMIGDTYLEDILPAMELGLKTIWVLCRPEREKRAADQVQKGNWPPPDLTVSRIGELLKTDLTLFNKLYTGGRFLCINQQVSERDRASLDIVKKKKQDEE